MLELSKMDIVNQISEYLKVWMLGDNDLRRFRRDLRRLSMESLKILINGLQDMYK